MKTTAITTALATVQAAFPTVAIHEEGGLVLVTAPDAGALSSAYEAAVEALRSLGRALRRERCAGKAVWRPTRSESVRAGIRVALTEEEADRHLRGW